MIQNNFFLEFKKNYFGKNTLYFPLNKPKLLITDGRHDISFSNKNSLFTKIKPITPEPMKFPLSNENAKITNFKYFSLQQKLTMFFQNSTQSLIDIYKFKLKQFKNEKNIENK